MALETDRVTHMLLQGLLGRGEEQKPYALSPDPTHCPCVQPERLLTEPRFARSIQRMRMDFTDSTQRFDQVLLPIIRTAAAFFQTLPASQRNHHAYPGGALEHALEVASLALRSVDVNRLLPDLSGGERMAFRVPVQQAIVSLAVSHDIGKPVTDLSVTANEAVWLPTRETLFDFLTRRGCDGSFQWRAARSHNEHVRWTAPLSAIHFLPEVPPQIVAEMVGAWSEPGHLWAELIMRADQASTAANRQQAHGDQPTQYTLSQLITDGVLELIELGRWTVNAPGSAVWYTKRGVELVHPVAFKEVVKHLSERSRYERWPVDALRISRIMNAEGSLKNEVIDGTPKPAKLTPATLRKGLYSMILVPSLTEQWDLPDPVEIDDAAVQTAENNEGECAKEGIERQLGDLPVDIGSSFISGVGRLIGDQWKSREGELWRKHGAQFALSWPEAFKLTAAGTGRVGAMDPQAVLSSLQNHAVIALVDRKAIQTVKDEKWVYLTDEGSAMVRQCVTDQSKSKAARDMEAVDSSVEEAVKVEVKMSSAPEEAEPAKPLPKARRKSGDRSTMFVDALRELCVTEAIGEKCGGALWIRKEVPAGLGVSMAWLERWCLENSTTPRTLISLLEKASHLSSTDPVDGYLILSIDIGRELLGVKTNGST